MKDLAQRALNRAQLLGAAYADIRVVHRRYETIATKDGRPDGVWTIWNPDGTPVRRGRYKDGVLDGKWEYWYEQPTGMTEGDDASAKPTGSPRPKTLPTSSPKPTVRRSPQAPTLPAPRIR